jgi:hypothetical protein
VGEITETVGGLNRNTRALSPKYAVEAGARVIIEIGALIGRQPGFLVEGVLALGSHGRIETFPRQVLGRPERGARDAGVQHGEGRVADLPGLGEELRVYQIRCVALREELRASGWCRQRNGRHADGRAQRKSGHDDEAPQHAVTRMSLVMLSASQ